MIIACEGFATGTKISEVAELVVETMASLVVAGVEDEWCSVRVFSEEVSEAETTEVEVAVAEVADADGIEACEVEIAEDAFLLVETCPEWTD